jgi:hypothetical protein
MSSQNQPLVVVSSLPSISNSNQFETVQPESRGERVSEPAGCKFLRNIKPETIGKLGLVRSLENWGAVAAVRQNAGFADHRKFSRILANCGYVNRS